MSVPDIAIGGQPAGAVVTLPWFLRLRWAFVAAEALGAIVSPALLDVRFADLPVWALILAAAVSNLALQAAWRQRWPVSNSWIGAASAFDILQLTGLLALTGGPSNPFTVAYLVYITLAAATLGTAWTWSIAALSIACYGVLFAIGTPASEHGAHLGTPEPTTTHLQACGWRYSRRPGSSPSS